VTQENVPLPPHADRFHPNLAYGVTKFGFSTIVNVYNYYNEALFGDDFRSSAVVTLQFYDERGRRRIDRGYRLPANGNLHIDLADELARSGASEPAMGGVYVRLIPEQLPGRLTAKSISTEFTAEHINPAGFRDFMHNTSGPVLLPSLGHKRSEMLYADASSTPAYFVLINTYLGPRIPLVSEGLARITIWNKAGQRVRATSKTVPGGGTVLQSVSELFPDLQSFLNGEPGVIDFQTANLARKPWIWYGSPDMNGDLCLEHV